MRRNTVLLIAMVVALVVVGIVYNTHTQQPADRTATKQTISDQSFETTTFTLDGKPYTQSSKGAPRLRFTTDDGYDNASFEGSYNTLSTVLGTPKATKPIGVNYAALSPALRSFKDVSQRAIIFTNEMIKQHRPLNLLPSKLITVPKPKGASPTSEAIFDKAGYIDDSTFASVYIELKDGVRSVVLVSGRGYSSDATPKNRFHVDHGTTEIEQPYVSSLPTKDANTTMHWKATLLKADCSRERNYRSKYSSSCALVAAGDNQPYAGHNNVILVAPVSTFESQDSYQNDGDTTETDSSLSFQLMTKAGSLITALSPAGLPYMQAPYTETLKSLTAQWIAEGGTLVGGNDISNWPAYKVG